MTGWIKVDEQEIKITNPQKVLWPELGIRKIDYLKVLIELSPYLLPHSTDYMLMLLRFPNGIDQKAFYQKKAAAHTPEWIDTIKKDGDNYINLNSRKTLVWLGNSAALEFHVGFNKINEDLISALVFDLDPSEGQTFDQVVEVALKIHEVLKSLSVNSLIKTSGATGLQIFIPTGNKYTYEQGRNINTFFANYFAGKFPNLITIERSVKKRGKLLYFDYLQMWRGKNMICVYSPRAVKSAAVSTPVTWEELDKGIKPGDFNILNIMKRLKAKGDLFKELLEPGKQNLDFILKESENLYGYR